ncbi:MAG: WXG100 family type VII secretion target [Propionibacteriaceae bacterium]|nr:WXG100 family type VII secretion target [Propionibacteriaceae bacterium]
MAQQFSSGEGALLAGAEATANARESVEASIKSVQNSVDAVGSGWDSPAARQMRMTAERWIESATKVNNVLTKFEADLRQTDTDYLATEEEQSSTFTNIGARLG